MIPSTSYISHHHVGHWHHLTVLGLFNEDCDTTWDKLTVKLNALGASNELPIRVVSFEGAEKVNMCRCPEGILNSETS